MRIKHQGHLGVFENLNRKCPADRGKVFQEDFQGIASFQMFEDDANGHPGADENGCSAEDVGVRNDTWGFDCGLLASIEFIARPGQWFIWALAVPGLRLPPLGGQRLPTLQNYKTALVSDGGRCAKVR